MGELDHPTVVDLPLRGEWTVERTPAERIPSHGTDVMGQRYAYDLLRTDDRHGGRVHPAGALRWILVGGRTQDCYGWGEPVHAALGGEVVAAVDGEPERGWIHVLREAWAVLRTTLRFAARSGSIDPVQLAGNHVIVRTAHVFAVYAHLAPGSVVVVPGQQVVVGDVVGRLGHSGNSTAPHLHFHLMDSPDPMRAHGIPCAFATYDLRRDGRWHPVRAGIPERGDRVRSPGTGP
ncbi:peptidoglycan DD-metalloendopeptidase family protein [Iamia sp. SCSIO 61187]|uniref:peptidoglycan DD-metalloendopeptidase family protein n=1 Tax=Iamia sp. SCSIO 61187 TaxID=2722752 RepID=UPI001C63965A|nr:peptidoglycan DD-metalloendopeptidase family protein [Iamia sp. SCSIO 61187]QYG92478.1 peptidoglycan DD-metalloendopeptidase family protein [Iamia sp. SCSIO 61187]